MEDKKCSNSKTATILLACAIVLFTASFILVFVFPTIYDAELKRQLPLLKDNPLYPIWRDLPISIYESLYFFNITNRKQFLHGLEKLKVVEVGPYVYEASWKKENIRWYPNGSVSYQERRTYQFSTDLSKGTEDDVIYQLNAPMTMAANMFRDSNAVFKFGLGMYFAGYDEHLVTPKTVREMVYEGYEDPIIKEGKYIIKGLPFKNGVFAWLYGKNDTYDGEYTVYTGEDDINKLNVIQRVDGFDRLHFWPNDTCNMMNGSSAEMGPPLLENQIEYSFYQSILCRTLTFSYSENVKHLGLTTKRFTVNNKIFANTTNNPDNYCFDVNPRLRTGVQDISACQYGAPVVISFPHFYLADPYYLTAVTGLEPDGEIHSSHIDVEPITGTTLDMRLQMQVNMEIQPIPDLPQFELVRGGLYPVFWVQFQAQVNEPLAQLLKRKVFAPKYAFYSVIGVAFLASVVLFISFVVIQNRVRKQIPRDEDDPIIECRGDAGINNDGRQKFQNEYKKSQAQYPNVQGDTLHVDDEDMLDSEGNRYLS